MSAQAISRWQGCRSSANAQFYAAINKMFIGEIAPIKAVWSHADDVTYLGPTGQFEHGWKTVLKDWEGQAALKLGDG